MENREISFEIKQHVGVLSKYANGWTKEVNIVAWNGGEPKYDIRDWDENHEHISRGITLKEKEMKSLIDAVKEKGALDLKPKVKDDWER